MMINWETLLASTNRLLVGTSFAGEFAHIAGPYHDTHQNFGKSQCLPKRFHRVEANLCIEARCAAAEHTQNEDILT